MNNWSLYFTGTGPVDAAKNALTNLVGQLRDIGLTITDVDMTGPGEYHALAGGNVNEDAAWTMFLYGTGDVSDEAYKHFRNILADFKKGDVKILQSGINVGQRSSIPVPA
jgi:hypothetical protein